MVVEPESLCWLTGRLVKARDGLTWAEKFGRFPALWAVVRDDGSGLGRGIKLERARRRAADLADLADLDDSLDVFHTLREGGRALRKTGGVATRALERAEATQKGLDHRGRQGQSRLGHGKVTNRLWQEAERAWDQAAAAETAWKQAKSAFEFFTPRGRLNDRAQAEVVVAAALPHLGGVAWAKTRRLLLRRESFTFLDQVQGRLAEFGLAPEVLSALLGLEGLRRRPWRLSGASRALALVRTVYLTKACRDLAGEGRASPGGARWGLACQQPRGVCQQRGVDAAGQAPENDAGATGPEASVLEPASVPDRSPRRSDALRPDGAEGARGELLGDPQAEARRIAGKTVHDGRYAVR